MHQKVFLVCMALILFFCLIPSSRVEAQNTTNAQQAQAIFDRTFQMVFGPQGSALHYDVNIIGIYKTAGDICYKGKKMRYGEERYASWNDGVTAYMVDKKSKKVSIDRANSDKKDKYLSKFKFNMNDFDYSWRQAKEGFLVSMKLKNARFMG